MISLNESGTLHQQMATLDVLSQRLAESDSVLAGARTEIIQKEQLLKVAEQQILASRQAVEPLDASNEVAPTTGDVPLAQKDEQDVLAALQNWVQAWSGQDARQYLAHYDRAFVPPGDRSWQSWQDYRRQRIEAPRHISLTVQETISERLEHGETVLTFRQTYRSDRYSDICTKRLYG